MMIFKELFDGAIACGMQWTFHESPAYSFDSTAAAEFDAQFPPLKAEFRASQEEFYILSRSEVR